MPLFSTRKLIKNKRALISSNFLKWSFKKKKKKEEKCYLLASKLSLKYKVN